MKTKNATTTKSIISSNFDKTWKDIKHRKAMQTAKEFAVGAFEGATASMSTTLISNGIIGLTKSEKLKGYLVRGKDAPPMTTASSIASILTGAAALVGIMAAHEVIMDGLKEERDALDVEADKVLKAQMDFEREFKDDEDNDPIIRWSADIVK